jgi:glutamate-1-semialdehyde 2,1-aminomutase
MPPLQRRRHARVSTRSETAFRAAREIFPAGVNSPVRSWRGVGLADTGPFFVLRGHGAELVDLDGNRYVDFVGSWGPLILGHAPAKVVSAVARQARRGASFGCPTELETRLARRVQQVFPSLERLRFVSSGTEAVMHALRLARGFTGRDLILKFEGCYHGASDAVLVKAGSGGATFGLPDSAGVPDAVARLTLTVPFNDLAAARAVLPECSRPRRVSSKGWRKACARRARF